MRAENPMAGYEPLVRLAPAVQAKPQAGASVPSVSPASVQQRLGEGEAMAPAVTERFLQAYGHDLSDVRLHRESPAATAFGARAVTVGRDVAFAPGEYKPGTPAGDRLIGHELAHVVQQSGGAGVVQGAGLGEDHYEREADRAAEVALSGGSVSGLSPVGARAVQRDGGVPASMPGPTQCEAPKDGAAPQCVAPGPQPAPAEVAPPPAEQTIYFEGIPLAPDPHHLRRALDRIVVESGEAGASAFASRFVNMTPLQRTSLEALYGSELVVAIQAEVGEAIARLEEDDKEYLLFFDEAAKAAAWEILENSRQQIEAELEHYGVRDGLGVDNDGASNAGPTGGPDRAAIGGLQRAARMLAGRRAETDTVARASIASRGAVERAARDNPFLIQQGLTEAADQDRKAWLEEEKAYKQLADQLQAEFPVLAAYASTPDAAARLEALASLPPHQAASEVSQEAHLRLANISTVEKELGGRFNVWTQPAIIRIALQQQSASPAQRRIVSDHAARVAADAESSKMLYAALAVGLGLLASIPTGGSSLLAGVAAAATIVGAGLTIYTTYESIETYALESAASGTGFDKARAIAQDDPSLMWLALDVVAAIGDIYGAARAFKALREAIAAARASRAAKLPVLIDAARESKLSRAAQSRILAEVVGTGTSADEIREALKAIAASFERLAPTTGAESTLAKGFQKAAEEILNDGRVTMLAADRNGWIAQLRRFVRSRDVPEEEVGEVVRRLLEDLKKAETRGVYYRPLNVVVLKDHGNVADIASTLAHELSHETQRLAKLDPEKFEREFQAVKAQQAFLRMLPADLAPADKAWLLVADDAEIEARILDAYEISEKPARFDAEALSKQILSLVRRRAQP